MCPINSITARQPKAHQIEHDTFKYLIPVASHVADEENARDAEESSKEDVDDSDAYGKNGDEGSVPIRGEREDESVGWGHSLGARIARSPVRYEGTTC